MNEQQVRALFLLADIPVLHLTKVNNGYWPEGAEYEEIHNLNPWWLVDTGRGTIEIGDRKQVVEIEWGGTGIIFPFVSADGQNNAVDEHFIKDKNVTKWASGCHAWGYGQALIALTNLRRRFARHDYLKQFWHDNPVPDKDQKNWLIAAKPAHWVKGEPGRIEVTIRAANETFAMQEFFAKHPKYRISFVEPKGHPAASRMHIPLIG